MNSQRLHSEVVAMLVANLASIVFGVVCIAARLTYAHATFAVKRVFWRPRMAGFLATCPGCGNLCVGCATVDSAVSALTIFFVRNWIEMIRVPAAAMKASFTASASGLVAIVARVVDVQSIWNRSYELFVSQSVNEFWNVARPRMRDVQATVSLWIYVSGEEPASRDRINLAIRKQPLADRLRCTIVSSHSILPDSIWSGLRSMSSAVAARSYFSAKCEAFA